MKVQETRTDSSEFRVLKETELDAVAGGVWANEVDWSQMPDRFVGGCGTMWLQDQFIKKFTPA